MSLFRFSLMIAQRKIIQKVEEGYREGIKTEKPFYKTRRGIIKKFVKGDDLDLSFASDLFFEASCSCGSRSNVYEILEVEKFGRFGRCENNSGIYFCSSCGKTGEKSNFKFAYKGP
jgi:hypothetical protein